MKGPVAFLFALVLACPAHAYLKAGPAGYGHWLRSATVQDGMATSLSAAYSFRKLRSAYAGPAVKLRRTTGGTSDINFTATGDFDTVAATTFCLATTCFLDTWYDQSGNARHATQATTANQPQYIGNCNGALPCARVSGGGTHKLSTTSVAWASPKSAMSVVGMRSGTAAQCWWMTRQNNSLYTDATANAWLMADFASGTMTLPAADGAWHAGIANIDGATSVGRIDGAETTGSITGSAAAGALDILLGGTNNCDAGELILWDGYAPTAGERTALQQNQRDYWTPLPLDNFAAPAAAYSMRRLKSSYAGPAIRLRRASDNLEADINFLGFTGFTGAPIDTAAAASHCASTTCTAVTWYDQSGNAQHAYLQGADVPPAFMFNCLGSLPCLWTTADQRIYTAGTVTPVSPVTFSAVGNRNVGTGACYWPNHYGANYFGAWAGVPDNWVVVGGSGYVNQTAVDAAWHAGIGVINGAASVVRIDAAENPGTTVAALTPASVVPFWGQAPTGTACSATEMVYWNAYALTAAERAALSSNQRNFWGIP